MSNEADSEIESYEYVAVAADGTVSISTRVGEGQQYRLPNIKHTDRVTVHAIWHATDGRSTHAGSARMQPKTKPRLDAWTISDTQINPVKLDGSNRVTGTVTCENVDAEPVDCLGGALDSGLTVTFNDSVAGRAGRGQSADIDLDAPGTQFDWSTDSATTEGDNSAVVRLLDDVNSGDWDPLASRTHTYRAYRSAADAMHVKSVKAKHDAVYVSYWNSYNGEYTMTVKNAAGETVGTLRPNFDYMTVSGLEPNTDYFVTWNASEYNEFNRTWTHKTSSFWVTTKSAVQAPTNLAREIDGEDIVLTWDAPGNAEEFDDLTYRVKVGEGKAVTVEETTYRVEDVPVNTDVEVQVAARVDFGDFGYESRTVDSEPTTLTVRRDAAPNPPVDPTFDEQTQQITWDKPAQVGDQEITGFALDAYRNGVKFGDTLEVKATAATSYRAWAQFSDLPAGEWTATIRTVAGDLSSDAVEVIHLEVDLPEPSAHIVDGVVHFSVPTEDQPAVGSWVIRLTAPGGADEWITVHDADTTSFALGGSGEPGLYTVRVSAQPVTGFSYGAGSTTLDWRIGPEPVDPPMGDEPEPGEVVLGTLTAPDFSPTGGKKVKVTGTVTRDGKPVAGEKVTVKFRKVKAKWRSKTVTTDAQGRYAVTVKSNRAFRAYATLGDQMSKRVLVRPTAKVTLTAERGSVTVKTVGYAKKAPKVRIQAKRDGRWVTVAKGRAFRDITVKVKNGTKLRAVSEKTRWVKRGTSTTARAR